MKRSAYLDYLQKAHIGGRTCSYLLVLIFALVQLCCATKLACAKYNVQVAVLEFRHQDSKLWNGKCCNFNCSVSCNSTFYFCLQESDCSVGDECPCTLGLITTEHSPINVSSVIFAVGENLIDNIPNPLIFDVMQWKGMLQMKIEVRHRARFDTYDLIDEMHITEDLNTASTSMSNPLYYGGVYGRAIIKLSFRILWNENCVSTSQNCHSGSNTDGHTALSTTSDCDMTSNIDYGSLSNFMRARRGISNAARNIGSTFYIGFMQNYADPKISTSKLDRNLVYIVTNDATNDTSEITVNLHYDHFKLAMKKRSLNLSHDYAIFKNKRADHYAIDQSIAMQFQTKPGFDMALFVINEELISMDGYTALPFQRVPGANDYHYYAISVPGNANTQASRTVNSAILIIGCVKNTIVTIIPSQLVADPLDPSRMIRIGESRTLVVDEFDTIYITSPNDLTGSHVVSDEPISFISGHECGSVPYGRVQCNHLVEQIPPTALWGKQFFISSISLHPGGDIFKMVASSNNTSVNMLCTNSKTGQKSEVHFLIPTEGVSLNVTIETLDSCLVTSSYSIYLVQFIALDSTTIMVSVPATHQYLNTHWFTTAYAGYVEFKHYMKIFVSQNDFDPSLIKLDGKTISASWNDIFCKEGTVCAHVSQLNLTDGAHVVTHEDHTASIGVIVYGVSQYKSYGYVGGMQLTPFVDYDKNLVIVHPNTTSYAISVGRHICFECITKPSSSEPQKFISWSAPSGVETSMLPNGTLCIYKVTTRHTGKYKCKAGVNSLTYTLTVKCGIVITSPPIPPSQEIASIGIGMDKITYVDSTEKKHIHIFCPLDGVEGTPTWLANGSVINQGIDYAVTKDYLRIQNPPMFSCTTYTCRVIFASSMYEESSKVCYRDYYAPTNLTISGPSMVIAGDNPVYFSCKANAFPEASMRWSTASQGHLENGAIDYGNGTLKLILYEGSQTTFCCTAKNSKGPAAHNCTTFVLFVIPHIKEPSLMIGRPGDCNDVTHKNIVSEQVGINLCCQTTSILYLHCVVERGNPKPEIMWLKDGSSLPKAVQVLYNGTTLLFQNMTIDLQAGIDGLPTIGGNYTCIASNPAGTVAVSSIITVIGDISQKVLQNHFMPLQQDLYSKLHHLISNSDSDVSTGHKHVVLMKTAKPLFFEDFDPGKLFDGSEKTISPRTMENMFNLVDMVPGSLPFLQDTRPLSKTYHTLVNKLVPIRSHVAKHNIMNAIGYLKELVMDVENMSSNNSQIMRLILYNRFKLSYLGKALNVEKEIELRHSTLSPAAYSDWYSSEGVLLEGEKDGIYQMWESLGDKSGVEKMLQLLDLKDHLMPLNNVKAIFEASKKPSLLHDDKYYLPIEFLPRNWFQLYLPKRIEETSDQIHYYHGLLKSKLLILEQIKTYYQSNKTYEHAPQKLLEDAEHVLSREALNNQKQWYKCIISRSPLECQRYSLEVNSIKHLMDQYANAYWATELYKAATNFDSILYDIQQFIKEHNKKMINLEMIANIKAIQARSKELEHLRINRADIPETNSESINFAYNSINQLKSHQNISFPVMERLLWYTSYGTASEYINTINLLNMASVNVNARIVKVTVSRRWLKPDIFSDSRYQLEWINFTSPGPAPLSSFAKLLKDSVYQFPLYPSAIVFATNIQISIKIPIPFHIMPSLLRMSFDQSFRGGFGPFVIGEKFFPGDMFKVKFLVEKRDTDILVTLPDAQLIGYICSVVPNLHKK